MEQCLYAVIEIIIMLLQPLERLTKPTILSTRATVESMDIDAIENTTKEMTLKTAAIAKTTLSTTKRTMMKTPARIKKIIMMITQKSMMKRANDITASTTNRTETTGMESITDMESIITR